MSDKLNKFELPTIFVVFGITGDLMKRKLLPGLFNLYKHKRLPKKIQILGFSRREFSDIELKNYIHELIKEDNFSHKEIWEDFLSLFSYVQGGFDDKAAYQRLAEKIGRVDGQWSICSNKLFYLAVPPQYYRNILLNLADSGLTIPCSDEEGWTRVILEKPFGSDLKNAEELDGLLGKLFKEEQIYRVDHFLGKETVRNILAFRFSNSFLAPVWNNKFIETIKIKFFEHGKINGRGEFYDKVGALRDVGQNHMLQLLTFFTMDSPIDFTADNISKRKAEILASLKKMSSDEIVSNTLRGQYDQYNQEEGVSKDSKTETYFKIKTEIVNDRWKGVDIYLEGGKGMVDSRLEVEVKFKHQVPCLCPPDKHYQNVFKYQINPKEEISMNILVKKPGHDFILQDQNFTFDYNQAYNKEDFVEAYEKLLLDMIKGDQTLFVTTEEIIYQWMYVESILKVWDQNKPPLFIYDANKEFNDITLTDINK